MSKLLLTSLFFTTLAAPTFALDFGSGFYTTGEFELEYLDSTGSSGSETLGYGSFDIGYEQSGGGFGGFVGVEAINFSSQSETAFYGALTYSGSFGKFQIGAPRNALDDYINTPQIGGERLFDFELAVASGSIIPQFTLFSTTDTPVGLRYDGTFGAAKVGVSLHRIESADILDVGVNYQLGNTLLRGGFEHARSNGSDGTNYYLGAEASFGKVDAGIMLAKFELSGNGNAAKLYATYSPIEALDLTATYLTASSSGSDNTFYGLNADYTFGQGVYVQGGILDGNSFGDALYNVSLGVKF